MFKLFIYMRDLLGGAKISFVDVVSHVIDTLQPLNMYGYSKQIKTISRAVVILGFRAVRGAAMASGVFDYFKDEESSEGIDMIRFWEHSIAVACISKVLAEDLRLHHRGIDVHDGLLRAVHQ